MRRGKSCASEAEIEFQKERSTFVFSNAQARETFDLHIRPAVSKCDYKRERRGKETLRTEREVQIYGHVRRRRRSLLLLFLIFLTLCISVTLNEVRGVNEHESEKEWKGDEERK